MSSIRLLLRRRQGRRQQGHEGPPRRQGRRARRDDQRRAARAPRLHHLDRGLQPLPGARRLAARPRSTSEIDAGPREARGAHGQEARRRDRSAARLRAQRRQVLDARDDGHDPEPRPQRPLGRGPEGQDRQRPLRQGLATAASSRCSATWCSASTRTSSSTSCTRSRRRRRSRPTSTSTEAAFDEVIARYKARRAEGDGHSPSRRTRSEQLAGARDAVFKSWMNPRAITYRKLNDIPHDLGTAVNVQSMVFGNMGDTLGHRRGLHPQSLDRREGVLRRVPAERAGRGRGGRHPHAAPDHRPREGDARRPTGSSARSRPAWSGTTRTSRTSSSRSRTTSSTCSRRATASARAWPRCTSRWTSWRRASSPRRKRS